MHTPPSITPTIGDNGDLVSEILTTNQAAHLLGLAASTLNKWRVYGTGPCFIKLGRAVRYRREDLEAYLASNTQLSTCKS